MLMHATNKQNYLHIIARILGEPHAGERGFKLRLREANNCTHTKRSNTPAGRFQLST